MSRDSFEIAGGDYATAGAASSALKATLSRLGADAHTVRRAMIAAYEAEMNVVVHAGGGGMSVTLTPDRLDVEVVDTGPGIPDVEKAMTEGYSTASAEARELGFGAGMGLPNIRRNTDRFEIESTPGSGTRLAFTVILSPQRPGPRGENSVKAGPGCRRCMRCVRACPTQAMRVGPEGPEPLAHLCIDCGACIEACPTGVIGPDASAGIPRPAAGTTLVVPEELLLQFAPGYGALEALEALSGLGFAEVVVTRPWREALRREVLRLAKGGHAGPVISPVCPAVTNLIETRFPSLVGNIAPFSPPLAAAVGSLVGRTVAAVALCPGECTSLAGVKGPREARAYAPGALLAAAGRRLVGHGPAAPEGPLHDRTEGSNAGAILSAGGVRQVIRLLEKAERAELSDVHALELHACDGGCFGSPLLPEPQAAVRWRAARRPSGSGGEGRAVPGARPPAPRSGLRLDDDMSRAIEKLGEIGRVAKSLPGKDCALCGAPTCDSLAEDIVTGRATVTACIFAGLEGGTA